MQIPTPEKYPTYLMRELGIGEALNKLAGEPQADEHFSHTFAAASVALDLGLRDQEQATSRLDVIVRTSKPNRRLSDPQVFLLGLLLPYRVRREVEYRAFVNHQVGVDVVLKPLRENPFSQRFLEEGSYGAALRGMVLAATLKRPELTTWINSHQDLQPGRADDGDPALRRATAAAVHNVVDEHGDGQKMLDDVARKIEVSDPFAV